MTVSALNPADPPVVTAYHMGCLLGCTGVTLNRYLVQKLIPQPDARVYGNGKLWKLSTIRAWRPDIADAAVELIARPPIRLFLSLPTAA